MATETTDDNTDTESTESTDSGQGAVSSTDTVELEQIEDFDGLVSTTEFNEVVVEKSGTETSDDKEGKTTSEKTEHKTETDESDKPIPYHKDPAWQRIIQERDTLADRVSKLETKGPVKEKTEQKGSRVLAMSKDDILEKLNDNPHSFLKDFAVEIRDEVVNAIDSKTATEKQNDKKEAAISSEKEVLTKFFGKRPDSIKMLQDGSLAQFLKDNPTHNAMSAYNKLTKAETVSKTDADKMVKDAVSKALKDSNKELKAMGKSGSKASTTTKKVIHSTADKMKNPDKYGGSRAVAVERLRERAAQQ